MREKFAFVTGLLLLPGVVGIYGSEKLFNCKSSIGEKIGAGALVLATSPFIIGVFIMMYFETKRYSR